MKPRHARLILTVAVVTFLAGCATGAGESSPFSGDRNEPEIKLFVTNWAFADVTIYGVTNGGRHRLGRVTGKKEFVFTMPLWAPSSLYLEIDYLAGPKCFTETMMVDPGDHLELIIQNENAGWTCRG